ncbi:MAG: nuclear transport factor 2 family protein [Hyphomonas sp.]
MARITGHLRAAAAAIGLGWIAACSPGGLSADDKTALTAEVEDFLDQWIETSDKGEFALLKPMYSDQAGFRWIENGRVAYDSAENAAAALDMAATAGYTADMDMMNEEVTLLSNDAAAVSADYTLAFDFGPGAQFTSTGVFTAVLVKEAGGWKFLQGHLSEPPAEPVAPVLEVPVVETILDAVPGPQ